MKQRTIIMLIAALAWMLATPFPNAASAEPEQRNQNSAADSSADSNAPYLGVSLGPMHPALAAHLSEITGKGRGVLVTDIVAGSPAHTAGIRLHDILVTYDKQDLYSAEQLAKLVQNDKSDRDVKIGYIHDGKPKETVVHLKPAPASGLARSHTSLRLPFDDLIPFERFGWSSWQPRKKVTFSDETASPWASFQSMAIRKLADDRFEASIEYRDVDGKSVTREFSGTRDEIRKSINQDDRLTQAARDHLLRSLNQRSSFGFFSEVLDSRPRESSDSPPFDF